MPRPAGALIARHISKSHADVVVIDDISLTVNRGDRIGLVGPNGIGKSTLLRILAGIEEADAGVVRREPSDLAVAYLPQVRHTGRASPGQATRAALEAIAEIQADVLVLDEPTNSLDLDGLAFLEELLRTHSGAAIIASHDRAFLELMSEIVDFEADTRRVSTFTGGWSRYEAARRRSQERHQAAYGTYRAELERVEAHAAQMQTWQQRGYGQGRKKKKTRDVAKALENRRRRVEHVEKPWMPWRLQMTFASTQRGGDRVAGLQHAAVERGSFGLGPVDLELEVGERLAITGPNGSGKSTLLAALLGEATLSSGSRWVGPSTVFATIPQAGGPFSGPDPLIAAFIEHSGLTQQESRSLLAKFALGADQVSRVCTSLSPGERTRAALALIVARGANTLILDEPTNDLDIEAIQQLEAALGAFTGTVVLVSHDRRFLDAFRASRTLELAGRQLRPARRIGRTGT